MHFFSVIVICCLIVHAFSRPSRVLEDYDKEAKDETYGERSDFDGYTRNEQKSHLKQVLNTQVSGNEPGKVDLQYEHDSSDENTNDEVRAHPDTDYLENNDDDVANENYAEGAHLYHNDMLSTGNEVKRTAECNKDSSNRLFQSNENLQKVHESEANKDEIVGGSEQAQYFKRYTLRNVERGPETSNIRRFNIEHDDPVTRDRRQVRISEPDESIATEEISTQINEFSTSEDEEIAIKRHIKKLSKEELDELLNSLSEDKRALLKNIIDNTRKEYDSINKREITKKAGANEENSFVGSEQSDMVKIQEGSASIEAESSMSPDIENSENTKKVESGTMCSKTTESVSSSEKSSDKIGILDGIEDSKLEKFGSKDNVELPQKEENIQDNTNVEHEASKNQKKREMNSKSSIDSQSGTFSSINNDESYCAENDDLSQLWNEESNLYNNNINKREIRSNNQNSIKSLEDSFPNDDDVNNLRPGSNMVPLVRVKRKNLDKIVQKRDGNFISNLKVPFFSNAVENIEEDNDEGNEFEDDAFFDRRANFAKNGDSNRQGNDDSMYDESNLKQCEHNSHTIDSDNTNLETDSVSLGSDTDAVLSGIEGVDDNVMYNGVSRNKRTAEELNNSIKNENNNEKCDQNNKIASENENNEISEGINQLSPRYQENDAFGSLPRNYEEDLARFKRIRRLKPLLTSEKNELALK